MPLKNVHYQKLETEESDLEEDELPPSHVKLQSANHVKGEGWWPSRVYLLKFYVRWCIMLCPLYQATDGTT